jgi:DNA-binding transcriptional MerR regulator
VTDDDELLTIGRFAHLTGLSAHALRHYDDVGLLTPAVVDAQSRYRRYRRDQAGQARLISALRWVDLPIEEIRAVLADPHGPEARDALERHRQRLSRQHGLVEARLEAIDRMLTKGPTVPTTLTGCHPVQIKLAVHDRDAAIAFYHDAFGMRYDVTQRAEDADYSSFLFGDYGEPGFFLIHLIDDEADTDRPGPWTFGLLVDDLDARHAAALAAGGTEAVPPRDGDGMPRHSAIKDPSGNWIWLTQG